MGITDLFSTTLERFNTTLNTTQESIFSTLAAEAGPFLVLIMTIAFAIYILQMASKGVVDVFGLIYFVFRSALIYGLVTGGVIWSSIALPFFTEFPKDIGFFVYNNVTGVFFPTTNSEPNFIGILDNFLNGVIRTGGLLRNRVDGDFLSFDETSALFAHFLMTFISLLMVVLAFVMILVSQIFLTLFLAISPLFLVWVYLGATKSIFDSFLSGIVKIMIVQILVYAVLGFFVSASTQILIEASASAEALSGDSPVNDFLLSRIWEISALSLIGLLTLMGVPLMASGISGGALSLGATTASFAGLSSRAGRTADDAVGAGVRKGVEKVRAKLGSDAGNAVGNAGASRSAAANQTPKTRAANLTRRTGN